MNCKLGVLALLIAFLLWLSIPALDILLSGLVIMGFFALGLHIGELGVVSVAFAGLLAQLLGPGEIFSYPWHWDTPKEDAPNPIQPKTGRPPQNAREVMMN